MPDPSKPVRARPLGNYPLAKRVGDFIFVSGTSARRPDGNIAGVSTAEDGSKRRDAAEQTKEVIRNLEDSLRQHGAELTDCAEIVVFLIDMSDFGAYNAAYGEFFSHEGPTRTTVAVRALPHPDMVVEMKAIAYRRAT